MQLHSHRSVVQTVITILCGILLCISPSVAQKQYAAFKKLYAKNDTAKISKFLQQWEKSNPNDPELYTSAFNFHFAQSKQEVLSLGLQRPQGDSFELTDSTGKTAGHIGSTISYNPERVAVAMKYINKGIQKFPNRLDMRFGKCFVLGKLELYKEFTQEIITTVEHSHTIATKWLWTENKPLDDAEQVMIGSVQSYLKQMYDTDNDSLLNNIKQVGEVVLKYYPKSVEVLSTTAVAYMLTKNFTKALDYLAQAETVNPTDFIVLNNIGYCYKLLGQKEKAITYYQKVITYGNEQAKAHATKELEELKK